MEKEFTCAVCDKKFLDDFEIDDGYKLNFSLCPKCGKIYEAYRYWRSN